MAMINVLNEIMIWHETYQPNYASSFLPGLSRQEIDSCVSIIDGYISEDIYQLYEWRNGTNKEYYETSINVEPFLYFRPFHSALEDFKRMYEFNNSEEFFNYQGNKLFPFMLYEKYFYTTVVSNKKQQESCIIGIFDPVEVEFLYPSLEDMMIEILDRLKNGTYYADQCGSLRK